MTHTWAPHHGQQLKALREAAGLEIITLAREHTLSVSQIQQLEEGGDSSFYSAEIKFNSGRKLLRALGGELEVMIDNVESASPVPEPLQTPIPTPTQFNRLTRDVPPLNVMKWMVGLLLLSAVVHTFFVLHNAPQPQPFVERASAQPAPTSASAPVLPVVASASVASGEAACPAQGKELAVTAPQPSKPGNYVHVVAHASAVVCISDAQQKSNLLMLKPGTSQSVYGHAPFRISSADLRAVRLFYQGHAVVVPDEDFVNLVLNEKK